MHAGVEKHVKLAQTIPVHLVYFTAARGRERPAPGVQGHLRPRRSTLSPARLRYASARQARSLNFDKRRRSHQKPRPRGRRRVEWVYRHNCLPMRSDCPAQGSCGLFVSFGGSERDGAVCRALRHRSASAPRAAGSADGASPSRLADWSAASRGTIDVRVFSLALDAASCAVRSGAVDDPSTLSVIDYSRPSTCPGSGCSTWNRATLLYEELVAHGQGSGGNLATQFFERPGLPPVQPRAVRHGRARTSAATATRSG